MQPRRPMPTHPPTHHGLGQPLVLSPPPQAIQNPGDLRLQERAWSAVCPLVAKLKRFYEFSLRLGERPEPPSPLPASPCCIPHPSPDAGMGQVGESPGHGEDAVLPHASVSPAGAGAGELHRSRMGTSGALSPENALRSLLEALTSPPYAPTQHLEREQALAKQFAEILHFTLSFDELKVPPRAPGVGQGLVGARAKAVSQHSPLGPLSWPWPPPWPLMRGCPRQMTNPAIQNDFSYYRRTISRNRINNLQVRGRCCVPLPCPGMASPRVEVTGLGTPRGQSATPMAPIISPRSWTQRAR